MLEIAVTYNPLESCVVLMKSVLSKKHGIDNNTLMLPR